MCGNYAAGEVRTIKTYRTSRMEPLDSPSRRRLLDGMMLALSVFGLADVVYLGVQEVRGFEGGCSGFDPNVIAAPTSGCGAALTSAYSTFLGISNVTLGYVFWGVLIALGLAALFAAPRVAALARRARLAFVGVGAVYAAYLTFLLVSGRSGGFCPFCFASHVLTFLLLAVAVYAASRSSDPT